MSTLVDVTIPVEAAAATVLVDAGVGVGSAVEPADPALDHAFPHPAASTASPARTRYLAFIPCPL